MEKPTSKEQGSTKPDRIIPSRETIKDINKEQSEARTEAPTQPNSDSDSNENE